MRKMNNKTVLRGAVCFAIFVMAVLVTFAVIREIPGGIKYTVKQPSETEEKNVNENKMSNSYIIKSVGDKVCVYLDGKVLYELETRTRQLSDYDKQRLIEGITVFDENELIIMREYLES